MSPAPLDPRSLDPVDLSAPGFADFHDELPLWSAPFGLALLDQVPLGPRLTYLDAGAGTGFLTLELAQRCGPEARVIAVDPWPAAMARLREKVRRLGLGNVTLLEQDLASVDLPPGSVDVIVSNLGLNNFADPAAALAACARVAAPGATLLLTTNLMGHMQEFYQAFRATLRDRGCAPSLGPLDAHERHRGDQASVTALLEGAGFRVERATPGLHRWRFATGAALLRHHLVRIGFLPAWVALVPPDRRLEIFAALERALDAEAAAQGELALTIPMLTVVARR